eukprot:g25736.t1
MQKTRVGMLIVVGLSIVALLRGISLLTRKAELERKTEKKGKQGRNSSQTKQPQDALWTWGTAEKHLPRAQAREKKEGKSKKRHMRMGVILLQDTTRQERRRDNAEHKKEGNDKGIK